MLGIPITFAYNFTGASEKIRAQVMQEFAANGAEHLVLTSGLMSQIMADANLPRKLQKEMSDAGLTFVDAHAQNQGFYDPIYPDEAYRPQMVPEIRYNGMVSLKNEYSTQKNPNSRTGAFPQRNAEIFYAGRY